MLDAGSAETTVKYINEHLIAELQEIYPEISLSKVNTAYGALSNIYAATGNKFVIIIDEWDVLIRDEAANTKVQDEYIDFLRGMFKGTEPTKYIQLAYLTEILPIKKEKTQSALNNFDEFTMLDASVWAPFIGFTGEEVQKLCRKYQMDYEKVKCWYDGYILERHQVYNPKAVVNVLLTGKFRSYWSQTASYDAVVPLINMNYDGLKTAVIEMISGGEVKVNTATFRNDTVNIQSKDDVLTYMILFWRESEKLLEATLEMDEEMVAAQIEKIHEEYTSVIQYHNENSLSSVLAIAYLSAMQYYFKPIRELPTGRGFADFVFLPKPEYKDDYPDSVLHYTGDILLVAINYDKNSKKHQCLIEEY